MRDAQHRLTPRRPSARRGRGRFDLVLAAWGALANGLAGCERYHAPSFAPGPATYEPSQHFTIIGDLQGTLPMEAWRENNDPERRRLLPEVARAQPAFVVMVGDLVSWGSSMARWKEFDEHSQALRAAGIPVLAVPGNHDYWVDDKLGYYFAHLPAIEGRRWYERRYGPLGMIFLDSNAGPLGGAEWATQRRWYEATLGSLDADETVLGILVFLHHAPLTNSSVVDDDVNVNTAFVPEFLKKKKTLAMLTGHAHGYERFEREGKAFIVTGGGGGPRSPLRQDGQRCHPDDKFRGPPLRNFNFVELAITAEGLHAYVVGLPKGGATFCRMEEFDLAWSSAKETVTTPLASSRRHLEDCYPNENATPGGAVEESNKP